MTYYVTYQSEYGVRVRRFSDKKKLKRFLKRKEEDFIELQKGTRISKNELAHLAGRLKKVS